jgi:predicted nucleic acid-binding protein
MVGRLVYLLDTNIILELLLDQDHADQVAAFLNQAAPDSLHISDSSSTVKGLMQGLSS